jgi:hypothetical protein
MVSSTVASNAVLPTLARVKSRPKVLSTIRPVVASGRVKTTVMTKLLLLVLLGLLALRAATLMEVVARHDCADSGGSKQESSTLAHSGGSVVGERQESGERERAMPKLSNLQMPRLRLRARARDLPKDQSGADVAQRLSRYRLDPSSSPPQTAAHKLVRARDSHRCKKHATQR